MAKFAHITPIRGLSSALTAPSNADELLEVYSSWLFFERHLLHIGRFGAEKALSLIDTVWTENPGAMFHVAAGYELPDYAGPIRRASTVLGAAGLDVDCLVRD